MNLQNMRPSLSIIAELSENVCSGVPELFEGVDTELGPATVRLDEPGFIFLDGHNRPYLARMYHGVPWLFYWHVENHWGDVAQTNTNRFVDTSAQLDTKTTKYLPSS